MDIESNNKQETINYSNNTVSNNNIYKISNNATDDKLDYTNMLDNKNKFNK